MKKIFVSSTFRDFNVERDAIRNLVMPRLNVIAQKYAETVSFVDLRWGVDTNTLETNEGVKKVLDVCLDEINNCKPYIIVLLGQRYGFVPTDTNLITEATEAKNFSLDNPDISVTELEIEYGALKNLGHTRFYFREIEGDIPQQEQQNYFSDENAHKLKDLKDRIEKLSKGNDEIGNKAVLKKYSLGWDTANNSLSKNLDEFVDMLVDDIEHLMQKEWADRANWSDYKIDRHLQWDFAKQKSQQYVNHDNLMERCFAQLEEKNILKICGSSGCGKTTLLSRLSITFKEKNFVVLPIFSGLTQRTGTAIDIIRYIIDYINSKLRPNRTVDMPDKIEDLIKFFRETIANWSMEEHTERLVIIIDAVDQLFDDVYKNNLSFIPNNLPDNNLPDKVQLIFSCLDNFPTVGISTIDIPLLSAGNKIEIIEGILNFSGRQLGNSVVRKICEMNASDNPLYLSLLIQRLEMMNYTDFQRIYTRAGELRTQNETHYEMEAINQVQIDIIENCSENLEYFCVELIELAAEIFGSFIKLVVNYIAISRYGLRESDLEGILSSKNVEWNALNFSVFTKYLSNFFIQREDGRVDFAHKNIRAGVLKQLGDENILQSDILDYLKTCDFEDLMRQQEIVYHCVKADNKKFFIEYVNEIENYDVSRESKEKVRNLAFIALNAVSLLDNGEWIINLLQNINFNDEPKKIVEVGFFTKVFNKIFKRDSWRTESFENRNRIFCSIEETVALLKFFSQIDYSSVQTANELSFGEQIQCIARSLALDLNNCQNSGGVQCFIADYYYNLGCIYNEMNTFGETNYANKGIESFKEAHDIYEGILEKNKDIVIKRKLIFSGLGIVASNLMAGNEKSLEIDALVEKSLELAKEICDEQYSVDNLKLIFQCLATMDMYNNFEKFFKDDTYDKDCRFNFADKNFMENLLSYLNSLSSEEVNSEINYSCVKILDYLSDVCRYDEPELALEYLNEELNLLDKNIIDFDRLKVEILYAGIFKRFATIHKALKHFDKAIGFCRKSIIKLENLLNFHYRVHDTKLSLMLEYATLGLLLDKYKNQHAEGRKYYEKAIEIFPQNSIDSVFVCGLYVSLAESCEDEILEIDERISNHSVTENLKEKKSDLKNLAEYYRKLMIEHPRYVEYQKQDGELDVRKIMFNK